MILTIVIHSSYLEQLFKISFVGGPQKVKQETIHVITPMIHVITPMIHVITPMIHVITPMMVMKDSWNIFGSLLPSITNVVGDWISTLIPDDAGLVGTAISMIITTVSNQAFGLFLNIYEKIPPIFKD
jgi:hypothetical protein